MKIVEDSSSKLVLKESAIGSWIVGGVMIVTGLGLLMAGTRAHKGLPLYAFGGLLFVVSVLVIVFSKSDTVVADKSTRRLSVTFKSLRNRDGQTQQCSFDDIQGVQLFQQYQQRYMNTNNGFGQPSVTSGGYGYGAGADTQTTLQMNLVVQLKNGTTWAIASEQHQVMAGLGVGSNSLIDKAQRLAAALGVPFQEMGAATPGQVVQAITQGITQKLNGQPESFAGQAASAFPTAVSASQTPASAGQPPAVQPAQTPVGASLSIPPQVTASQPSGFNNEPTDLQAPGPYGPKQA